MNFSRAILFCFCAANVCRFAGCVPAHAQPPPPPLVQVISNLPSITYGVAGYRIDQWTVNGKLRALNVTNY